jgi:cytochrome bd ubiquinol oxidase subunit II
MVEIWFALLSFMFIVFVVLDGWDIGAGALHLLVARTPLERREVIAAIGPLWSWHEVWLVAAGGTFVLAFPRILAASFAGFYLALWMVLWSFVLRGMSLEVGGHMSNRLWQTFWDFVFAVSNTVLAILFGAALGNVIRGVPIDQAQKFSMPLFTHFGVTGRVGILDWYTVSVAVFTTVLLAAHGATYLWLKTERRVHERSERLAGRLWTGVLLLFPLVSIETWLVRPELFQAMASRPLAWIALAALVAGGWAIFTGWRRRAEARTFAGSCTVIASLLAGAAIGVFPIILRSTLAPEFSMTAHQGATAERGLTIALFWWPVALVLALTYFVVIFRSYQGKVRTSADTQGFV